MQTSENNKPIKFKEIDPNAPRFGKAKFTHVLINKRLFKDWQKANPEYATTWEEFQVIWDQITQEIRYQVLNNPDGLRLPFFIGDLHCQYVQLKDKPLDPGTSIKAGVRKHYLNWHTDRRVAKLIWSINHARKFNRWVKLFMYEPCKAFQLEANVSIKDHPGEFKVARVPKAMAEAEEHRKYNRPYVN